MRHAPRRPLQMKSISGATQECQKRLRFVIISSFVFAVDVFTHQSKLSIAVTQNRRFYPWKFSRLWFVADPNRIILFTTHRINTTTTTTGQTQQPRGDATGAVSFPWKLLTIFGSYKLSDDGYTYTYIYINWVNRGRMAITHQIKKRDWVTDTTSVHRPRIFFRHSPIIL